MNNPLILLPVRLNLTPAGFPHSTIRTSPGLFSLNTLLFLLYFRVAHTFSRIGAALMPFAAVHTHGAPQPIGPYSQAIDAYPFVFVSGQIPLDPASGELAGDTIETQALCALRNLKAVLAAAGLTPKNLVKTTVFIRSMADFSVFNALYNDELGGAKPARSVVEVSALPKGALVEIEAIACR
jgi:2-iminobutanoate/2-iminopropanoate deaminase